MMGTNSLVSSQAEQNVYSANGITYVNDKASSINDCYYDSTYAARAYAGSTITVSYTGTFNKVVLVLDDYNGGKYLTGLDNVSVGSGVYERDYDVVTITFGQSVSSFTTGELTKQVRIESITLTTKTTGQSPDQGGTVTPPSQSTITSQTRAFSDMLCKNGPMTEGCLPSVGTPKVLVVPVNLKSSNKTDKILNDIEIAFNGTTAQTGWYSVKEYYQISSYGKLNFDFNVLDSWYTPKHSASYYDSYYDEETGNYGSTVILEEVLDYYDSSIDFSDYDYNNDGIIDSVWLIYNYDVNYDDANSDYWAYVYQSISDTKYDGKLAAYYGWAGTDFMYDREDTGYDTSTMIVDAHTFIHETGHLMGLDDYYDYDETVGPVGGFYGADMMDYNVGDHSSINKLLLGWITPTVITGKGEIQIDIKSFAETGQVLLIANHEITSIYDEYLLVEFYTDTLLNANDQPMYSDGYGAVYGVRVLHVDANIFYNSYGEVDYNQGESYITGFKYDNSDESKLFVDMLYCAKTEDWATDDMLYTTTSKVFGVDRYSNYKMHDATYLKLVINVLSISSSGASLKITIN